MISLQIASSLGFSVHVDHNDLSFQLGKLGLDVLQSDTASTGFSFTVLLLVLLLIFFRIEVRNILAFVTLTKLTELVEKREKFVRRVIKMPA